MKHIVHMTSAHPRYDTRIFLKECGALAETFRVSLVVADGKGDEVKTGVGIVDAGASKGRTDRIVNAASRVYRKALALDADLYHCHDPELLWAALRLKRRGKIVVFDIHEMVTEQIKSKHYLPKWLRAGVALAYGMLERVLLPKLDGLVLAEASYRSRYAPLNDTVAVVQNMPDDAFLAPFVSSQRDRNELFYVGAISDARGLDVTLRALKLLKQRGVAFKMHYIGNLQGSTREGLDLEGIEEEVVFYGRLTLDEAYGLSLHAKAGLSVLQPIGNYLHSYSTKIFEYMAIGLPVITSDFELYKDVVEKHRCGICIDPRSPEALAEAIVFLFDHPDAVARMGENGKEAVHSVYNWSHEKAALMRLYGAVMQ
ncbi:glycosyltransferase [Sulfurimonas sp. HSL1-2]|uniref:glycosyltransferase n=1 Tax=Thiomicrolovo zhangzhouensis TaxID=3131933 RepID=UPI0031F898B3